MDLKRFLVTAPIALLLTMAGFAMGPDSQSGVTVQVAGVGDSPSMVFASTDAFTLEETPVSDATPAPTLVPTPIPLPTQVVSPTPTREPVRSARVPILMYHYISVPPPDADKYRLDLSVTPENFEAQVKYLATQGYTAIRLSDLSEHLLTGKPLPPKPIVLTFDDGYLDNYENAFPILMKYQFVGTFFVITNYVDAQKPGYMNWNQLEEMAIEGNEIGSHTMSHFELKGKSRSIQASEIAGSKLAIESRIGTPVKSFCYPSGKYDANSISALRSAGYLGAVTIESQGIRQTSTNIFEMQRIRVRGNYSLNEFEYWLKYFSSTGK